MIFKNQNAIVTGASTGIGKEIAKMIASEGGRVALVARSKSRLLEVKREIENNGGRAEVFSTNLRKKEEIEKLAVDCLKSFGTIHILVHAAAVWHDENKAYAGSPLVKTPMEQIAEVLEVGIQAPMFLTRLLLPSMIKNKKGKILGISGTFSGGAAGWLHYYVSKLALEHFLTGLSQEMREHEIQVNCISPSDTKTEALQKFFPDDARNAIEPMEVAKLARFLLSADADHVTGQRIVIKNKKNHTQLPPNHGT